MFKQPSHFSTVKKREQAGRFGTWSKRKFFLNSYTGLLKTHTQQQHHNPTTEYGMLSWATDVILFPLHSITQEDRMIQCKRRKGEWKGSRKDTWVHWKPCKRRKLRDSKDSSDLLQDVVQHVSPHNLLHSPPTPNPHPYSKNFLQSLENTFRDICWL